jgi:stage II sporulation protein D
MNISVGLMEHREAVEIELAGTFTDAAGKTYPSGRHNFASAVELKPVDAAASSFAVEDITIGIGFHWERRERQVFRGALRILKRDGLTVINDVSIEDYVASVISSEMSATCPLELLKAHAVISRSWLWHPKSGRQIRQSVNPSITQSSSDRMRIDGLRIDGLTDSAEILRWYGREAHQDFDVCADDHCQRYQGITKATSAAVDAAVRATAGQMLVYNGEVCDARFSKCCGGIVEEYRTAWEDVDVPYLVPLYDGAGEAKLPSDLEQWILSAAAPAYCNTRDATLLSQILPGFDQETRDFYRWTVTYTPEQVRELIQARLNEDVGEVVDLIPLERGPSGRIIRLAIRGRTRSLIVGKELEIRRALSRSHLYSSAFVVQRDGSNFVLKGAGWGHGVGLCQIGAAVMASVGKAYDQILAHYYPGASVEVRSL